MTINFELLDKLENDRFLIFLARINQISTTWLIDNLTEDIYSHFEAQSWIKHIKSKSKKEHLYNSLRLSEVGKKYLEQLFELPTEEQDETVANWLSAHYLKIGKQVGNSKRLVRHIKDFRLKSGIEKNNLLKLCLDFVNDESNMEYNNILEYSFYKALTAFQTRFQLEDSRIYKHYLKHKTRLDKSFEIY
jgi:hypothetical protein